MARDPAIYRHTNDTDTLVAIVLTTGVWSATGAITGDHSAEPGKYVFSGLADDTLYEIRKRVTGTPLVTDPAVAAIQLPAASQASVDAQPKYGDTTKLALILDSAAELQVTLTKVVP